MGFININKDNYKMYQGTSKICKTMSHQKCIFALIYMEGCGPCNAVRPEWAKLKNILHKYKNNPNISIVDIDKDIVDKLECIKYKPMAFPTILYIADGGKTIEQYEDSSIQNKDRTIDSFVEWITSKKIAKNNTRKQKHRSNKTSKQRGGKWSSSYKNSINCRKPKGFSQKQYCKYSRNKL